MRSIRIGARVAVVLAAACFLALPAAAPPASDAELRVAIVGTWAEAGGCGIDEAVFNADGTFLSGYVGYQVSGTYTIMNGELLGKHDKMQIGDGPDGVMLPVLVRFDSGKLVLFDPSRGDNGEGGGLIKCK